jgi:peptidoglycan/LPS O-acetylase OafA/YrhL
VQPLIPNTPEGFRRNNFDFIRFVLASLVILSHSWPLLQGHTRAEPIYFLSRGQTTFGGMAVDGFFILSGFLIAASWARSGSFLSFASNRVLRIYPGFIVCLLLCLFVVGPLFAADPADYRGRFIAVDFAICAAVLNFYNLRGTFPDNAVSGVMNGSMWTIPHEMVCYLLLPVLAVIGALKTRILLLAAFAATWITYAVGDWTNNPLRIDVPWLADGPAEWSRLIAFFIAGIAVFQFRDRIPRTRPLLAGAAALTAVGLLFNGYAFVAPVSATYALLFIGYSPRLGAFNFGKRGDCSYGMYLYAFPIQQMLVAMRGVQEWQPLTLFLAAFALTVPAAVLSWLLVEKPCLSLKRRKPAPRVDAVVPDGATG